MISVKQLTITQGHFKLKEVSFTIPSGSYAVLMGPSGGGKTTVIEAICGLRRPNQGVVTVGNRNVTHLPACARGIGYVTQENSLFPTMTVFDNIAYPLQLRRRSQREVERSVRTMAAKMGVEHLLDRGVTNLSGGESQRVALARAMVFGPSVMCLDEPLGALDEEARDELEQLLMETHRAVNATTLHITHSLSEARRLSDLVLNLRDGTIQIAT